MKIKYTASYGTIEIKMMEHNFFATFVRNVWQEVPEKIGKILLEGQNFISEDDMVFDRELFNKADLDIGIWRFGALGDLIMLLPVVRYLKKHSNNRFHLITQECYAKTLRLETKTFESVLNYDTFRKENFDKVLYLDGVLENDHSLVNPDRLIHRVKLYEKFFGIEIDDYDFSMYLDEADTRFARKVINACRKQK